MKRWIGFLCLFSLYASGARAAARSSGSPETFTVLSYKVQSASPANLALIGAKLDAFSIAGIQGCYLNCETLLNAAHHQSKYYFSERPHRMELISSGLASLSNFPLLEVKTIYYKAQIDVAEERASKGLLLMRYQLHDRILDVYNTHIQKGFGEQAAIARQSQTVELMHYISNESPWDHVVVLLGDFDLAEPTQQALKTTLNLQAPSEELGASLLPEADHVLYRSGSNTVFKPISCRDLSGEFIDAKGQALSDSAPIAVDFQLE